MRSKDRSILRLAVESRCPQRTSYLTGRNVAGVIRKEELMYVITGAIGITGTVITEKLLAKGEKVRVVGRDAKRLERFANKGAEPFVADEKDAATLSKAFSGAKAVYAMIPPNIVSPDVRAYQEQVSDDLAAAITKNGIKYA